MYLSSHVSLYVQSSSLDLHSVPSEIVLHVVIHAKSSELLIYQESNVDHPSHTTQLDHHSTSVFAINTNHAFETQFLFQTIYKYFHAFSA